MTRIVPARLDRLDSDAATGPRRTPRRVQPSWRRCRQAGGTLGFRRCAAEPPLCGRPGKQEEAEGARKAVEPAGLGVLKQKAAQRSGRRASGGMEQAPPAAVVALAGTRLLRPAQAQADWEGGSSSQLEAAPLPRLTDGLHHPPLRPPSQPW